MEDNNSLIGGESLQWQINDRVIIVQLLVMIFLCINFLLILTFFQKECFYTTTRYILFAVTLLSDSFVLLVTDVILILHYFQIPMHVWLCIIISFLLILHLLITPVTLTAMTLERYVAICMPLRHGELCSRHSTVNCILIIHGLSSVPCIVVLSAFFASVSHSFYEQHSVCSVQIFLVHRWQKHLWSTVNQLYFLIMCIMIVFSYVKILKVAKTASGENKKSTWKGLRTVILHAFQLLLCLIQLLCPFIEAALPQINVSFFNTVRYFNYIMFSLAPRCLSPLIYGLRDEKFFHAIKNVCFGLCTKSIWKVFP
uniref:odorant receptor 131-2-like n=1 Tax=Epinephelus lanceolatus TaxID=310571 RepID=UPI0014470AC7|nr:odorant receptor 131-2-like [Epinephelus lanceolatus]